MPAIIEIEKRPGWDWDVKFLDNGEDGDGSVIEGRVFGVMTIAQVLEQAYDDFGMPEDSEIIAIVRVANPNSDPENVEVGQI